MHSCSAEHRASLSIYNRIVSSGRNPSISVIIAALKACSSLRDLETGQRIHNTLLQSPSQSNLYVASTLIDMYAKCSSLVEASRVFHSMPRKNLVAWNCLILGYASHPSTASAALDLFWEMQQIYGLTPNRITLLAAIKACSSLAEADDRGLKLEALAIGRQLHLQAAGGRDDEELHVFLANALVEMYSKCGSISDSLLLFERIPEKNLVSWNTIILTLAQAGLVDRSLEMFRRMDCKPDVLSVIAVLKACSSLASSNISAALIEVREIHRRADEIGASSDPRVAAALVKLYSKCREWEHAVRLLDASSKTSSLPLTAMIQSYAQAGLGIRALELWNSMPGLGIPATSLTLIAALKACMNVKGESIEMVEVIQKIHRQAGNMILNDEEDMSLWNALIEAYAEQRHLRKAWMVFENMASENTNLVSWNSLLVGCGVCSRIDLALELLMEMKIRSLDPSAISYTAVLKACTGATAMDTGRKVLEEIHRAGLLDDLLLNSQLDFWGKCGCTEQAQQAFDSMSITDTVSWNSLISSYSRGGKIEMAMELMLRMREEEREPDEITLLALLSGCSHRGEVDLGKKLLERVGVKASSRHLGSVIDMLSRANRLEEATQVIQERCNDRCVAWLTLLAGCEKWQNVNLGETAFQNVLRLSISEDDSNVGFVLMSNIYAAAGMWTKLHQLRSPKG